MAPKTYRNCGQWILTDHHGQLVFAGQKLYTGQSPLSILDGVARRLLVPQMRRARQYPGDRPLTATGVVDGRTWATRVHRVHCPISDRVLGVLGAYFPVGDGDLGDPPLVAAWAHPVKPVSLDGPLIPSFWTPDLFTLTGIDPSTASRTPDGRCVYPVQQVTTEVVHPEDRHSTLVALDRFYWDETDALRTHSLRIQTDVVRYVRWAGRRTIIPEAPLGEQCWAGGPVHALTRQQYLDSISQPEMNDALSVAVLMAPPLFVVDPHGKIALTTENFLSLGVEIPRDRLLSSIIHPTDYQRLLDAFHQAVGADRSTKLTVPHVRMRTAGQWTMFFITVVARPLSTKARDPYYHCTASLSPDASTPSTTASPINETHTTAAVLEPKPGISPPGAHGG